MVPVAHVGVDDRPRPRCSGGPDTHRGNPLDRASSGWSRLRRDRHGYPYPRPPRVDRRGSRLLLERVAFLLVPVVLEALVPVAVYAAVSLIGGSLSAVGLFVVSLCSTPSHDGGNGPACSVALDREAVPRRAAVAVVFGLFLVDSVVSDTGVAWPGAASPVRYYDPFAILVDGDPGLVGGAVLAVAALLAGSPALFSRQDVYWF